MNFFRDFTNKFPKEKSNDNDGRNAQKHVEGKMRGSGKDENKATNHDQYLPNKHGNIGGECILYLSDVGAETADYLTCSILTEEI